MSKANNFITVKQIRETLLGASAALLDMAETLQTTGILVEVPAPEVPAPVKKTGKKRGRKPGSKNKKADVPPEQEKDPVV